MSIGPEILVKFFSTAGDCGHYTPVVVGDIQVLERCNRELGTTVVFTSWKPGDPLPATQIPVVQVGSLDADKLIWGQPDKTTGNAMADYITTAVKGIQDGFFAGMTTCPISKSSLNNAGFHFPGHTEMLACLTGAEQYAMMMAGNKLRVTLVTIHKALKEVSSLLSVDAVFELIAITNNSLIQDFGITAPKIAVAGLNPHASENGIFGNEEQLYIAPAIDKAHQNGINAQGPFPPDTIFYKSAKGEYDAVVCMYHDQGLVPFKLLHFSDGVNVTIGLPIVRTSVDHGTAYDIAGKGIADQTSLQAAVELAAAIASRRKQRNQL